MAEEKFCVYLDNIKTAENMTLETAVILAKALFNEYYLEPSMKVTIQKIREGEEVK